MSQWILEGKDNNSMDRFIHTWHGSVRPRVDELISLGNSTVQLANEIVYRTIPSYGSLALVFATGWVVAIAMSICVSCWICSRRKRQCHEVASSHSVATAVPFGTVDEQQQQQMAMTDFEREEPTAPPLVRPPPFLFDPTGMRRGDHAASFQSSSNQQQRRIYPRAMAF